MPYPGTLGHGQDRRDMLTSLELCAGAGGQALGLEQAGFSHVGLVEADAHCRATLRLNRPAWRVFDGAQADMTTFDACAFRGVDLLAGGLPCPPFSVAGKQLGARDERNLFPDLLRVIDETAPRAVMVENVRGFLGPAIAAYRAQIFADIARRGYVVGARLYDAAGFGAPQTRARVVILALRPADAERFVWPEPGAAPPAHVGDALADLMASGGWPGAPAWIAAARGPAPTIVGGSKKHGGPDLGPTRAKRAWAALGVDGLGVADAPPGPDFEGAPRLTVPMVARLQGFPDDWRFAGRKTAAYRQVGNAFPPVMARAVGERLRAVLRGGRASTVAAQ